MLTIATAQTKPDGTFSYILLPTATGNIQVQASWLGNRELNGAISGQSIVVVLPMYFILVYLGSAAAVTGLQRRL